VLQWTVQLCLALNHLSATDIVHRDMKPANLLLSDTNSIIYIADFGLAKSVERGSGGLKSEVGTPLYTSPEICRNEGYGTATDVWSLGVIMHETLSLDVPFYGADDVEFVISLTESEPSPLPSRYSSGICELVRSMLTKDAVHRPSAAQLLVTPTLDKAAARVLSCHRPARIEPRLQRAQTRVLQAQYEKAFSEFRPGSTPPALREVLREPHSPSKKAPQRRQEAGGTPPRSPIYKARQCSVNTLGSSGAGGGSIRPASTSRPHSKNESDRTRESSGASDEVIDATARPPPVLMPAPIPLRPTATAVTRTAAHASVAALGNDSRRASKF
jgi:serine/threonine protein kinase